MPSIPEEMSEKRKSDEESAKEASEDDSAAKPAFSIAPDEDSEVEESAEAEMEVEGEARMIYTRMGSNGSWTPQGSRLRKDSAESFGSGKDIPVLDKKVSFHAGSGGESYAEDSQVEDVPGMEKQRSKKKHRRFH